VAHGHPSPCAATVVSDEAIENGETMTTDTTAESAASQDTLRRIRALLAQAEHEATGAPEAEAFTAKATALMAKYGVDRTMLLATDPSANKVGDRVIRIPGPYAMGKLMLLFRISEALGVRTVRRAAPGNGQQEMHLFGLASDLERVDMLYTSLLLQANRLMKADQEVNWYQYATSPKSWTRDWQEGYAAKVHQRLKDAEALAQREAPAPAAGGMSTALVFVRRDKLVAEAVSAKYPRLRKSSGSRRVGSGYGTGQRAGARADLGGSRLGSGSGRALGR
jgi:uncharacterized protein DUF2786